MCLYPKFIQNQKYTATKKNGGTIPPLLDKRALYVPIGCQRCMECRQQKAREWSVRLYEEVRQRKDGKFITFTFNDDSLRKLAKEFTSEGYQLDNDIATLGMRRFLERWRKKFKTSVRHWMITELGTTSTERIHLHGIIWTKETISTIEKVWGYGYMWNDVKAKNYVNGSTVNYITKYIQKVDIKHKLYIPKILTSAGIGAGYNIRPNSKNNQYKGIDTDETYRTEKGHKLSLPIYYRNKIYNDEQRERLWLQRLDKNERWVCGVKIQADDAEAYYQTLNHHRKRNKQLGYGKPEKYNPNNYELQRRKILQEGWKIQAPHAGGAGNSRIYR